MAPNIVFTRRNIQIAHKDRFSRGIRTKRIAHLRQKIELLAKFFVDLPIGNIAPCGNVEIMDNHPIGEARRHMAGMTKPSPIPRARLFKRQLGQDCYAIISFLTTCDHVGVAQRRKAFGRDFFNGAFAFLQAQNIWRFFTQQFQHQFFTQPHRVDVPCCKCERHFAMPFDETCPLS